jgi:hypothetical protein
VGRIVESVGGVFPYQPGLIYEICMRNTQTSAANLVGKGGKRKQFQDLKVKSSAGSWKKCSKPNLLPLPGFALWLYISNQNPNPAL